MGASTNSRIWYNKFIRIASRFSDATHIEKNLLGLNQQNDAVYFITHKQISS